MIPTKFFHTAIVRAPPVEQRRSPASDFFHGKVVATAASDPNELPLTLIKATVEDGGNAWRSRV